MHILALTHVVPNPPDAGPKIKTHYALRMLAREHQVELLTFARDERERAAAEELRSWCARVTIVPLQRRKLLEQLYLASGWLRGKPFLVARDYRGVFAAAVRARLAEGGIDVVHADQLSMAQYLPLAERAGVATVFDAHNAVYDLIRDLGKRPPTPFHRLALALEWRLLRRCEGNLSRRSTCTLTVSTHDLALLTEAAGGPIRAAIVPIGVEVEAITPLPINRRSTRLLSIATMLYPPNAEALRWFRGAVWPTLRGVQPGIAVDVIGSRPPDDLVRWAAADAGVHVPGYVADTSRAYRNAAIFIVPLRSGSGVRVKILEAMARGIPVVSTSIGVAGLALRHNEHLLIADTPEDFSTAIVQLLGATERRAALAAAARIRVLELYDWRRCCLPLLDIYHHLAEERATTTSSSKRSDSGRVAVGQRA